MAGSGPDTHNGEDNTALLVDDKEPVVEVLLLILLYSIVEDRRRCFLRPPEKDESVRDDADAVVDPVDCVRPTDITGVLQDRTMVVVLMLHIRAARTIQGADSDAFEVIMVLWELEGVGVASCYLCIGKSNGFVAGEKECEMNRSTDRMSFDEQLLLFLLCNTWMQKVETRPNLYPAQKSKLHEDGEMSFRWKI